MTQNTSFFQRFVAYTLCCLIFLQQPLVIAADLVSFEQAKRFDIKRPLSVVVEDGEESLKSSSIPQEPEFFYAQTVTVADKAITLQLSSDLDRLDGPLHLFGDSYKKPLATLFKRSSGFVLNIYQDLGLTLMNQDDFLPNLFVNSEGPVSLDATRLTNPLTIHGSSVKFLKDMRVDSPVILWAKGKEGPRREEGQAPITMTQKTASGQKVVLEAKGQVATRHLTGTGNLTLFAGNFRNKSNLLLQHLKIIAHIENEEGADLGGRDSLWLEGTLLNKGGIRTKGALTEKALPGPQGIFKHLKTSHTYSVNSHIVDAHHYIHNGKIYSAGPMRLNTQFLQYGPSFHFIGERFVARAVRIDGDYENTCIEASRYIELSSYDSLDSRARLYVHKFSFPYKRYFGDIRDDLDEATQERHQKAIQDIKDNKQDHTLPGEGDLFGVLLTSAKGTLFQAGYIDTTASDILFKASHVGHAGTTRSGNILPGSVKIIGDSANLRGTLEASRLIEARISGPLQMDLCLRSPLTLLFANSLDLSGDLRTTMVAKIAGAVRFLDQLKAKESILSVEATSLTLMKTPGSTAGPQEIGSLHAKVDTLSIETPTILYGPSWAQVERMFSNSSPLTIHQFFEATMPGAHHLGSMDGPGIVSLKAPSFHKLQDWLFGTKGTTGGRHLTTDQDVVLDKEHDVNHQVGLHAASLTVKADQAAKGGLFLHATKGDLDIQERTLNAYDQLLSLEAMGGDFYGQGARTRSGILSVRSSGNGSFGGGIFSAPQMRVSIAGVCDTSTTTRDILVPVTRYDENWGDYFTTYETQKQHVPAAFLSYGTTKDGGKAYQYIDAGMYQGQGVRGQNSYYTNDGGWHRDEITKERVIHHSDGPLTIRSHSTFDLSQADLRAGLSDTILLQSLFDMNLRNIHATGGRARVISTYGDILEHTDVLTNMTYINRSGCGGDHTHQTTSTLQQQRAEGNFWNMFAGRQTLSDGTELPTVVFQVSRGKSIISQASTLNVPDGLVIRIAPDGTIQQTTATLSDTFSQHHETWGKGYNNHFYEGWSHIRGIGGSVSATAEVSNCFRLEETGYDRRIRDYYIENAQDVIRRSALNHFSAYSIVNSQKDGADIFSSSGSSYHSQTMNARFATPVLFDVGHYIERKNRADQPATTTWEGPILFSAKASSFERDQLYRAIEQTVEQTSTSTVDNMNAWQPARLSLPQFSSHSRPIDYVKGFNQLAGHANQAMSFASKIGNGNYWLAALQVAGQFTNCSSTSSEQYSHMFEMNEAAPFIRAGRASYKGVSMTGVLAGYEADSPEGEVPVFDVRGPHYKRTMESRSNQVTSTTNPCTLSFGEATSWSTQSASSTGSIPSFAAISGNPNLRIRRWVGNGFGLITLPTGGTQDFTRRTERVGLPDGQSMEFSYLVPVEANSGYDLIDRPTRRGVFIDEGTFNAAPFTNYSHQEWGSDSWNVTLGGMVLACLPGGGPLAFALAAMTAVSASSSGGSRSTHRSGTTPLLIDAQGAPIVIGNRHSEGNVTFGQGVTTTGNITHVYVPEINTSTHEEDTSGKVLDWFMTARDAASNIHGLYCNYNALFGPKPPSPYDSRSRVALTAELMAIDREDAEARDRQTASSRPSRASQRGDSDRDPYDGPRRGRTSTRYTDDQRSARSTVNFLGREANVADDFNSYMDRVDAARSSQQRQAPTQSDRDGGNQQTRGRARTRQEDVQRSAMRHAEHVTQGITDGIAFMHKASGRAHTPPPYRYAREEVRKMEINNGGVLDPSRRQNAMEFHSDRYMERIQERQDARNAVLAASMCVSLPVGALMYGGVTGLDGLHDIASGVNRSATNVLGHMATDAAQFYIGGKVFESLFACAKAAPKSGDNPFTSFAANSNFRNPLAMDASLAARIANPTNQNMVRLFDIRSTGTNGPSFITRMGQGGRSDIPGVFGAGRAEGFGAGSGGTRAVPGGGGSSGPSQVSFIKRIDKQQAHAERMARGDGGATTSVRERLFGADTVIQFRGDRVRPINGRQPINSAYAGKTFEFDESFLIKRLQGEIDPTRIKEIKLEVKALQDQFPYGVPFTGTGHPDFARYAIKKVNIDVTGNNTVDFRSADKAAGFSRQNPRPESTTWHHHEDGQSMILLKENLHDSIRHTGGGAKVRGGI